MSFVNVSYVLHTWTARIIPLWPFAGLSCGGCLERTLDLLFLMCMWSFRAPNKFGFLAPSCGTHGVSGFGTIIFHYLCHIQLVCLFYY